MLIKVLTFLKRSGMSESHFGRKVVNNPNFVRDLRNGSRPRAATAAKIRAFIRNYEGGA